MTFDDIGKALFTLFQVITLEGWTDLMYNLSDATLAPVSRLYCMVTVILGSFFPVRASAQGSLVVGRSFSSSNGGLFERPRRMFFL